MLATVTALGQRARRTSQLRALALLEMAPNGKARLVPIAIKVGDKFYDAGLYRADPTPMALDTGVVYEGERSGDGVGLFTITQAQPVKGVWVGAGQWRLLNAPESQKEAKAAPEEPSTSEGDEPPVLRKPGAEAGTPSPPATGKAEAPPAPAPPKEPQAHRVEAPAASSRGDEDSERPILRRGKPAQQLAVDAQLPETAAKPGAGHASAKEAALPASTTVEPVEVLTAISDAGGPDPRSYVMPLRADEQAKYGDQMRRLAYAAIQKFAATRPQHKPAAAAALSDVQLKVFDLHYNNEPDLVLSARLPQTSPAGTQTPGSYFVTVVARVDMYGEMRQLFTAVTDSSHLDAYPRLEFIDAVDAEGSGSGQLLFRQVSDTGYSYVIYRVGMDKLWPLFEGAGNNF